METVASPCIKVCRLDPAGQWCTGCGRLLDDIGSWAQASDEEKQAILSRAERRMATFSQAPDTG
ncbi:MAG: DUF1289 domain-containing protein [Alphaproteobacteria bacterium]|nr:DUF1289 domain-containing protein [Alphaproteobacteria bacterium]MBU1755666.1 DUF1289 domain-containing protein [Alphaproteobacteria bacterium]